MMENMSNPRQLFNGMYFRKTYYPCRRLGQQLEAPTGAHILVRSEVHLEK